MSEHFIYTVGKRSAEPSLGSASFPDGQQTHSAPIPKTTQSNSVSSFPGNTHLIFEVNKKDHSIVVMIVDEVSSKIIRTVPGDAMDSIPSGEFLQLKA
jgi:hypothetical protein